MSDITKALLGHTLVSVEQRGDEEIRFTREDGAVVVMFHDRDCCESVTIEDVAGDLQCLIGHPILVAEEVSGEEPKREMTYEPDSYTWTFYKIATVKGWVDIRWYGESNGYYSESVSINVTEAPKAVPQ